MSIQNSFSFSILIIFEYPKQNCMWDRHVRKSYFPFIIFLILLFLSLVPQTHSPGRTPCQGSSGRHQHG
jgi:hypothetical protein